MYPTAAQLVASVCFAALAWYASILVVPNLPDGVAEGMMPEINAAVGLVIGWRVMGRGAGSGWVSGIGIGLTTGAVILVSALLIWAGYEMLMRSLNTRYDGPVEAIEDMIALVLRYAGFPWTGQALPALAIGSMVLGLLAEAAARREAR